MILHFQVLIFTALHFTLFNPFLLSCALRSSELRPHCIALLVGRSLGVALGAQLKSVKLVVGCNSADCEDLLSRGCSHERVHGNRHGICLAISFTMSHLEGS